ncbi:MAG: threonine/serine dehydratase [Gemmatimonadales bacterium]|jgi:threonine dehydratase|nr:threonine/serine dehydratase [Gemmatimonadales bacterium]MDG2241503.1 threonine/serine dehydratase [Longimicrobiales bacterium]MBT3498299.1 threonine/serine dehydratase [Gemmatimonadales bacterium]MBT3774500.1 threonine/serine dehydratase [Gemmatimonadales bacterium]MBT3958132.1 threonine/serine dehydratase [Gemmatimonadales bacterium]
MSDVVQGEGLVGLTEIESAGRRLAGVAVPTPLLPADAVTEACGAAEVRLKCENLQRAGSFKIRGAYNFVSQLSDDQVGAGIITYSSGNHAQAVALAGKLRGLRVVVVMPTTAPKVKRDGAERLGAQVYYEGTTSVERRALAEEIAAKEGLVIVPPFDHRHIIAGQGTVGLEIARDWDDVDLVLAPIGGGGLASGVAAAVKRMIPHASVIGVEPEGAASMRKALDEGHPALLGEIDTIADGLCPVIAGELTYEHARDLMDDVVTVTDDSIKKATEMLVNRHKLIVEYSGAATTAALLSQAVDVEGLRVAVIVSGGNLDPMLLAGLA